MKRFFLLSILIFGLFVLSATSAQAQEEINSFDVQIQVAEDSSFTVTETIVYDFGFIKRHGIYRDIPYSYKRLGAKYNVRLKAISVVDDQGDAWPYTTNRWGGNYQIKIGDPDVYVSGENTYKITYSVERAINYFDDHDELYWNVTGNEWEVNINQAAVTVQLPQSVNEDNLQLACYTGYYGSTGQDCSQAIDENKITFTSDDQFFPQEGLSIVIGWPKGVVTKPDFSKQLGWWLVDNWPIAIPLIVLGLMFYLWYSRGRDPRIKEPLIPIYESPNKLPVAEIGTIVDEKVDLKDISATIIQLAIKGYLRIKEIEKKKLFGKKDRDYELIKLQDADDKLKEYEREIFKGIFDTGKARTVSSLKNQFYTHLKKIKKTLYELVVMDDYFPANPEKVRSTYLVVAIVIVFLGFFLLVGFQNVVSGIGTMFGGVVSIIFSRFMPRKTKRGAEVHQQILGFKWFLSVTEKERLKFHNAPAKSPKEFEELLPYAMVLEVEKEWAEQFKDIYVTPPEWYEGRPGTAFGAWYLASALGSMSTDLNSAIVASPRGTSTAGFGGSGFGGGGFSGGGFGGGGGGSW